jgi:hypothetical protein
MESQKGYADFCCPHMSAVTCVQMQASIAKDPLYHEGALHTATFLLTDPQHSTAQHWWQLQPKGCRVARQALVVVHDDGGTKVPC